MSRLRAFTLIELLVVIAIIALLASVVLASLNAAREKGRMGGARYFATQVDHVVGDQAVGIWDFDECNSGGATVIDRSGFGNTGNIAAAPSWPAESPSGRGCSILLGSNQYITVANASSLDFGSGDFTVSLWIKNSQTLATASDIYGLVSKTDGATNGFVLSLRGGGMNGIFLRFIGTLDVVPLSSQTSLLSNGSWHHVAFVRSDTTGSIYIDGIKIPTTSPSLVGSATNNLPLLIGKWTTSQFPFVGSLDDIHLFAKALTASEVGTLYATQASLFRVAEN